MLRQPSLQQYIPFFALACVHRRRRVCRRIRIPTGVHTMYMATRRTSRTACSSLLSGNRWFGRLNCCLRIQYQRAAFYWWYIHLKIACVFSRCWHTILAMGWLYSSAGRPHHVVFVLPTSTVRIAADTGDRQRRREIKRLLNHCARPIVFSLSLCVSSQISVFLSSRRACT